MYEILPRNTKHDLFFNQNRKLDVKPITTTYAQIAYTNL